MNLAMSGQMKLLKPIWEKGTIVTGFSPDIWRIDICGHAMQRKEYGKRDSPYGWEIDHINPVDNGGRDNYQNLQPLYWGNNVSKGNQLDWKCPDNLSFFIS